MDPIRPLLDRLVETWKGDAGLAAGQLYLINRLTPLDVEATTVGDHPALPPAELEVLLERAADPSERPGFEVQAGSLRGYLYPITGDGLLVGIWLMFPAGSDVDWAHWTRESARFSQQLSSLRTSPSQEPPTFHQLAEAFPDEPPTSSSEGPTPALHWEHSQSRVDVALRDDLSQALIVDSLPIF